MNQEVPCNHRNMYTLKKYDAVDHSHLIWSAQPLNNSSLWFTGHRTVPYDSLATGQPPDKESILFQTLISVRVKKTSTVQHVIKILLTWKSRMYRVIQNLRPPFGRRSRMGSQVLGHPVRFHFFWKQRASTQLYSTPGFLKQRLSKKKCGWR